jgi:hypothetical protein
MHATNTLLGHHPMPSSRTTMPASWRRRTVGVFYLVMGGVNLGVVAADAQTYRGFADHALFAFVRDGWASIVMAHPATWGLLLMVGEIALGTLLLQGGRATRAGWFGVIAFHLLLLPFGFWLWTYAVPALLALLWLARPDLDRSSP